MSRSIPMKEFAKRAGAAKAKADSAMRGPKAAAKGNYSKPMAKTRADDLMVDLQKDVARAAVAQTAPAIKGIRRKK